MSSLKLTFSLSKAISFGFRATFKNLGYLLAYKLLAFIILFIFFMWVGAAATAINEFGILESVGLIKYFKPYHLCYLSAVLFALFLWNVFTQIRLLICDTGKAYLWWCSRPSMRALMRCLGATLLYYFLVVGGLICLVIPGIYLAVRFHFYQFVIIDKKVGIIDAFRQSLLLSQGCKRKLFIFCTLDSVVNIIPFIFTLPTSLASAFIYRELTKQLEVSVVPAKEYVAYDDLPYSHERETQRDL